MCIYLVVSIESIYNNKIYVYNITYIKSSYERLLNIILAIQNYRTHLILTGLKNNLTLVPSTSIILLLFLIVMILIKFNIEHCVLKYV